MTVMAALASGGLAGGAGAQTPITERTGVSVLVAEFNEGGSFGALAGAEELGGLDAAEHRFGIDVSVLNRFAGGLALGVRLAGYRYDPVGLGARAGVLAGQSVDVARGTVFRAEAEAAYLWGRAETPEASFMTAALEADAAALLQQRVGLVGSVDLRIAAGPYATLRATTDAWDVEASGEAPAPEALEGVAAQGGVQVGAAVTFELLDARIALAPMTRVALVESGTLAPFSALPGGGLWVEF